MKILNWNCARGFKNKFHLLEEFDADICVIQECENPETTRNNDYKEWASNYIFARNYKNTGVGIFAKDNVLLEKIDHDNYFKQFLPVKVNNKFKLLNVWSKKPYIEEIHNYHHVNKSLFDDNLVMCGDFNANVIWDKSHKYSDRDKSFTAFSNILKEVGLENAYSLLTNEKPGEETQPTSFFLRKIDRPYHIDYVFAYPKVIKSFEIQNPHKWVEFSDHFPILFEIDENKF